MQCRFGEAGLEKGEHFGAHRNVDDDPLLEDVDSRSTSVVWMLAFTDQWDPSGGSFSVRSIAAHRVGEDGTT